MGCFYITCGLTHLPVMDEDPVLAMLIRAEKDYFKQGAPNYVFDLWSPATFPLRTSVDDYGRVKLTPEQKALWMKTLSAGRYGDSGNFESSHVFANEANADGGDKYDKGMYQIETDHGYGLWVCHLNVFDTLCETNRPDMQWRDKGASIRQLVESKIVHNTETMQILASMPKSESKARFRMENRIEWGLGSELMGPCTYNDIVESSPDAVEGWRNLMMLNYIMGNLRMTMGPIGAWGAQDTSVEQHEQLWMIAAQQAKKINSRWDEDEKDDEEASV